MQPVTIGANAESLRRLAAANVIVDASQVVCSSVDSSNGTATATLDVPKVSNP